MSRPRVLFAWVHDSGRAVNPVVTMGCGETYRLSPRQALRGLADLG
jgi:hypothetical protein